MILNICYKKSEKSFKGGFTIIELIISVAIFAFMTLFLVAKYSTFNQGILLTNLAYEVALSIRNAQSYGINVKSLPTDPNNYSSEFSNPYGVHFDKSSAHKTEMIFFADTNPNGIYESGEEISTSNIKGGSFISELCVGTSENNCNSSPSQPILDISFKRPDPNAIIRITGVSLTNPYAEITVQTSSGLTKKIIIRSTGEIAVKNK